MDLELKKIADEILREMLLELDDDFDKSTGSFAYDILKPPSEKFADLRDRIREVDEKRSIYNLKDKELDDFVAQFTPIRRHEATFANGDVVITGKPKTKVPKGTLVGNVSQAYETVKTGELNDEGVGVFHVTSVVEGKDGNVDIGGINMFPVTINGLETVYNKKPFKNGFEEESDDSLRIRYFNYINLPVTSGNRFHYLYWAKQITGVGLVRIQSLWDGDNTVKLVLTDSNGQPAGDDLVKKVQDYIDPIGEIISEEAGYTKWGRGFGEAPVGAFCTVISAKPINVRIEANIRLKPNYTIEEVENEFVVKMANRFSDIALDEEYNVISLAKVGCIILGLEGVVDYDASSLKINGKQENIIVGVDEVAIFDEVVFDEI